MGKVDQGVISTGTLQKEDFGNCKWNLHLSDENRKRRDEREITVMTKFINHFQVFYKISLGYFVRFSSFEVSRILFLFHYLPLLYLPCIFSWCFHFFLPTHVFIFPLVLSLLPILCYTIFLCICFRLFSIVH